MSVQKQVTTLAGEGQDGSDDLWMSEEESREAFDQYARAVTGLSGSAFLEHFAAGEFAHIPDDPEHRELMSLVTWAALGR